MDRRQVVKEFASVINRHSLENGSDTPDFILAEYLFDCLISFNTAANARRLWYGEDIPASSNGRKPVSGTVS